MQHYSAHEMTPFKVAALFVNGTIAFGLNVISFTANKKVGALSMTVAIKCWSSVEWLKGSHAFAQVT